MQRESSSENRISSYRTTVAYNQYSTRSSSTTVDLNGILMYDARARGIFYFLLSTSTYRQVVGFRLLVLGFVVPACADGQTPSALASDGLCCGDPIFGQISGDCM